MESLYFCRLLSIIYLEVTVASILFFLSRFSQVRQKHLGPLRMVKPLEATSMAVLREATLKKRVTTRFVPMRIVFTSVRFEQLNSAN